MKKNSKILNILLLDKYRIIYIYITSILSYFILNLILNGQKLNFALIFRAYYIVMSIALFILLNHIKKYTEQYVSKIIWAFFSLMIMISSIGFMKNINSGNIFSDYIRYIDLSSETILLLETLTCYSLGEYIYRKKKISRMPYLIFSVITISLILIKYDKTLFDFIRIFYWIIEIPLFLKIFINTMLSKKLEQNEIDIVKAYMFSTILIIIIEIYGYYSYNKVAINILVEIIHLINFRIVFNFIVINFIRDPYKELSKSLSEENRELDKLNHRIVIKNGQLENSINVLKSKECLYSTFFRFMPHPIIILNSENNRIIFVNEQFLKFADINEARGIINKKINKYIEFMPSDIKNKDYNAIFRIGNKKKFIESKFLANYSDETKKLILIKDNTSKVQTDEIRKEIENKKNEERMRTQFLSSISHDLKTPINVIYSAAQVEKIYIEKGNLDALKKYNAISKQNCISLIKLTNNLIDNSRINSNYLVPRLEKVNIVDMIEEKVMSLVDYVKWNDIDLIFDTNVEECYLDIDKEFMDRIILNLVSNAVKFTQTNGKIYVIITEEENDVKISIKDNGSGMDQKFIDKAFNRYAVGQNSVRDVKSGTGIGLFVVKQLVELQDGIIYIQKNLDRGTNVTMEFKKMKENMYE
ncbi:alkaline phosphatase synthesis sensor protein PhoR [Clostridium saccharobutylicum]|uniref:sensor histidine kinase n=1 Tax=Clostridium saccharobutylicum TaxID=169679 RepID=UPI000983C536|nr:HAMP domain-containing sensor histidine kinase [Clostridium saccharobutylicum]AQS09109.1 alkaline phosphatase synthesis sensor protein PhoR [Clostridium saccharobutylicum]MBC2435388.1 HAMP domain-containing histidine kinase [Clostridium saccharobutylicum]NSB87345.1 signal transduction histidine kinase [Clostridium saccharobutylicum]NYC28530.1 signal transduction histidine kinase [Clostridium saccharobutylicum]OOM15721.1 alkaline phosphatase synthesis sensor protein PhoR [Clostridium sacchar